MKKKIWLFCLLSLVLCCWACLPSNPVSNDISQSSLDVLREKKPAHTVEILTWTKDLYDLERARDHPEKENFYEYWDKKREKKKQWLAFSNLKDEFQQLNYLLTGNARSRKLEKEGSLIATWTDIIAFEKNAKDFLLCRDDNRFVYCQNGDKKLDIGHNDQVLPRFFQDKLWSVQLIDENEDKYGVFKDQELLYTFQATFITFDPILAFEVNENGRWLSYSKHFYWEEKMQDIIVHNGENLNQKYWRDHAFALEKVRDQIFHFSQKQGEIWYVVDGKEFPLDGEEIASWKCCSAALFYPTAYPDFVDFTFKKGDSRYNALLWL